MKKGGILSLIVYILYTLLGGGLALYYYVTLETNNDVGLEGLGMAIVLVIGIIFGAAGLVATILKIIHMKSGWGFFGVLCIIVDLAAVSLFSLTFAENLYEGADALIILPFIVASIASFISNVKSLKD